MNWSSKIVYHFPKKILTANFNSIKILTALTAILTATASHASLTILKNTIIQGWPDKRGIVCKEALPYSHFRAEMSVEDGLIFRGDRIAIPKSLRPTMKQKVHAGLMGINSCLQRARTYLYWPGMSEERRQVCQSCETCLSFQI